jgi:hypothetical protein
MVRHGKVNPIAETTKISDSASTMRWRNWSGELMNLRQTLLWKPS